MTLPAFIKAFKRFSSARGLPDVTLSDNFKTFKSAEIKRFLLHNCTITWKKKFVSSPLPWWGGFYKFLVRSVKFPLRKILDN